MTKGRLWLRCSDCGEEWASSAVRVREEWGVEVYPKQEYCPECGGDGEIVPGVIGRTRPGKLLVKGGC